MQTEPRDRLLRYCYGKYSIGPSWYKIDTASFLRSGLTISSYLRASVPENSRDFKRLWHKYVRDGKQLVEDYFFFEGEPFSIFQALDRDTKDIRYPLKPVYAEAKLVPETMDRKLLRQRLELEVFWDAKKETWEIDSFEQFYNSFHDSPDFKGDVTRLLGAFKRDLMENARKGLEEYPVGRTNLQLTRDVIDAQAFKLDPVSIMKETLGRIPERLCHDMLLQDVVRQYLNRYTLHPVQVPDQERFESTSRYTTRVMKDQRTRNSLLRRLLAEIDETWVESRNLVEKIKTRFSLDQSYIEFYLNTGEVSLQLVQNLVNDAMLSVDRLNDEDVNIITDEVKHADCFVDNETYSQYLKTVVTNYIRRYSSSMYSKLNSFPFDAFHFEHVRDGTEVRIQNKRYQLSVDDFNKNLELEYNEQMALFKRDREEFCVEMSLRLQPYRQFLMHSSRMPLAPAAVEY